MSDLLDNLSSSPTNELQDLGEIYDRYASALYGIALKLVKNEKLAEEVLKHTYIYVYKNYKTFRNSDQNPFIWMINVLRAEVHDMMKNLPDGANRSDRLFVYTGEYSEQQLQRGGMTSDQHIVLENIFLKGERIEDVAKKMNKEVLVIRQLLKEAIIQFRKASQNV